MNSNRFWSSPLAWLKRSIPSPTEFDPLVNTEALGNGLSVERLSRMAVNTKRASLVTLLPKRESTWAAVEFCVLANT